MNNKLIDRDKQARRVAQYVLHLWPAPAVVVEFLRSGDPDLREEAHGEAVLYMKHIGRTEAACAAADAAMWACGSCEPAVRLQAALEWAALALQEADSEGTVKEATRQVSIERAAMEKAKARWRDAKDRLVAARGKANARAYARLRDDLGIPHHVPFVSAPMAETKGKAEGDSR